MSDTKEPCRAMECERGGHGTWCAEATRADIIERVKDASRDLMWAFGLEFWLNGSSPHDDPATEAQLEELRILRSDFDCILARIAPNGLVPMYVRSHVVAWTLDTDGRVTPRFKCCAPPGSRCRFGGEHCSVEAYLSEDDDPMACYTPRGRANRKPLDGNIDVWLNPLGEGWLWDYTPQQGNGWAS